MKLTKAQRDVLVDLADGGVVWACLNHGDVFDRSGRIFHEATIRVYRRSQTGRLGDEYRIRNKTLAFLYSAGLVGHPDTSSGDRPFTITDAGRLALQGAEHDQ